MSENHIQTWHEIIQARDPTALDDILADDVVFHSPVVYAAQTGKTITQHYLSAALDVLLNDSFRYVREIVSESHAALEFVVEIDGVTVNGVDLITWDEDGKIRDFKVMLRPLKAINLIHQKMAAMLNAAS